MAPARQTTPTTAVQSSNFFFYIYTYVHVNILLLNTEERSSDGWNHHKLIPPNVMARAAETRAAKATAAEKNRKVEVMFFSLLASVFPLAFINCTSSLLLVSCNTEVQLAG